MSENKEMFLAAYRSSSHITSAMKNDDYDVRCLAMSNPSATAKHIDKGLKDNEWRLRVNAATHPNATRTQINTGLLDRSLDVAKGAIKRPDIDAEHIIIAQSSALPIIRAWAVKHKNATSDHAKSALADTEAVVRDNAKEKLEQLNKN